MREVLSMHIGQAGVQIGTSCWELFCAEHGLDKGGNLQAKIESEPEVCSGSQASQDSLGDSKNDMVGGFSSFFDEMSSGNYTPRAMFIDLEPSVIDQVRNGPYRELLSPKQLLSGVEDAANNYARGYCTVGKNMLEPSLNQLRKMIENCEKSQGFMPEDGTYVLKPVAKLKAYNRRTISIYHSFGGGTGSGFHALLSQSIFEEYPKLSKLEIGVFPSPTMATAVVEPYNAVLSTHATLQNTDCVFLVDNEALNNICYKRLDIDNPNYGHLNRLLAQTISSITASLRFNGTLNADFIDFQTNLVPYPRIHFPVMSYAPIVPSTRMSYETLSVADLTAQAFSPGSRLAMVRLEDFSYIACCLLYRGDVVPKDVNGAIAALRNRKNISFVPWCPTGFKVGINSRTPRNPPSSDLAAMQKAVCMICNSTALKEAWSTLNYKFALMADKRAFMHWYTGDGLEENDFLIAQEDLLTLELDYTHLDKDE